jgi:hypothetical protein
MSKYKPEANKDIDQTDFENFPEDGSKAPSLTPVAP